MGKTTTTGPARDNNDIGNNLASAHEPGINKGKAKGARNSCRETIERGMQGTKVLASKRYPLRFALSSGRVLRSGSTKNNKARSEPLNDSAATQPAVRRRKSVSRLGSSDNSVRVLRSTSKNKNEACSETLYDTAAEPAANKRKGVSPSKVGSPNNNVRVLRSALKEKNGSSSAVGSPPYTAEPAANKKKSVSPSKVGSPSNSVRVLRSALKNKNDSSSEVGCPLYAAEPAANKRKGVSPSKVGSPNNSVRVLHSALENKDGSSSNVGSPLYNSTVAQPAAKKRKIVSPSKVGRPVSSVRVLRSASEKNNEACNDSLNDSTAAQPAAKNRKSGRPLVKRRNNSVRVLRSASTMKNEACSEPLNDSTWAQPAVRKRKGGRPSKERSPKKDYLKIRQRVRYVLNRMSYERSLIQAYASEGWKGQSSDKIRPEKELERAKAEILRCKLRIREAFQNMDSLLSEGKLEETLFDSAGEICSEDIFCAVCGSKDVTLQNDIILCDGACDRGFHQNCLDPPLLAEDIPVGDEGWFCPACLCKVDCIDALNELQGSKLSILDSWEKVFPEAASLANGSKQIDASDLPSHDSEDNGKNPALAERHMVNEDRCSAEDEGKVDDLGLPSEDSEDVDFDPAGPDSSEDESNSNESDFTSDSDYFCAEIAKSCGQDDVLVSPLSDVINRTDRMKISSDHSNGDNANHAFMDTELEQDMVLPVSSRRQVERLDYKKLYDEAYGEESSNSSDEEEWSGKEKLEDSETDGSFCPAKRHSRRASDRHPSNQHTQSERLCGPVSEKQTEVLRSNGGSSTARKHRFDPIIKQKLKVHFEKDPYPSRTAKETLAQELGLTFIQVHKWFSSTRHSSRVAAAKKGKRPGNHTTENNGSTPVNITQTRELNDEARTADGNGIAYEEVMVQNDLDKGNKEDTPLSGGETEMEAYRKESSYLSDDEEWSGISTPQKELEDTETDSLARSFNPAKRRSRRAPVGQQNNEHTPDCERLHGSVNQRQIEALQSNGSSSTARKFRFGQKLNVQFEKDPYPSRTIMESLAQELGLTFLQVRKLFSSAHYSSKVATKKEKHLGNCTTEKNDSTPVESIQVREPNDSLMEKLTADRSDMVSKKLMLQINLNEGNEEDLSQFTSCQQTVVMTPTTNPGEVGPPGYRPGENQSNCALWNTSSEERVVITPTISREVGPPGYGPEENQGSYASWNISSEQRVDMTPTSISIEVAPPGYVPGENHGNVVSWNTSSKLSVDVTPTTISRGVGPPGYVPGENQGNVASWNTSSELRVDVTTTAISREVGPPGYGPGESQGNYASWTSSEQRVDLTPTAISREVGPPGYGPGENQADGASWNTSFEQRVFMTPTTTSREAGPPGYGPGESQGNYASWTSSKQRVGLTSTTIPRDVSPPGYGPGEKRADGASRNTSCEQSVFMTPFTISREAGPPGYWPGENQGSVASKNIGSPKGKSVEKAAELADEARRKAIQRELRRMKRFR